MHRQFIYSFSANWKKGNSKQGRTDKGMRKGPRDERKYGRNRERKKERIELCSLPTLSST